MQRSRFLTAVLLALALTGCMRHEPDDTAGRGLLTSQVFAQPQYAQRADQQPAPSGRGLFNTQSGAPQAYAQQPLQPPSTLRYVPPRAPAPRVATPQYDRSYAAAATYAYAPAASEQPYTLGPGDRLRVVVFGQDGISNTYMVDAGGNVSLALIGSVPARGLTTQQLGARIAERLKQGYVREPHVTVEVETYRPFFILGEVTTPGQYPYVADMTVEKAIAIAGGFAPRAYKQTVELTRNAGGEQIKSDVPLSYPLRPGDTVMIKERWF